MEHNLQEQKNLDLLGQAAQVIGCKLEPIQFEQLHCYVCELLKWNKKLSLTGLASEKDVIGNLVADSLAAYSLLGKEEPGSIIDIGTGGGIPGIPLKVAIPSARLTLVEPNQKKVAFLHLVVGTLGLKNVNIAATRIEQVKQVKNDDQGDLYHKVFDWVVIKGLRLESALPYVSEILSERGCMICWRAETVTTCHELFGLRVIKEVSYQLPFGFGPRILSVLGR